MQAEALAKSKSATTAKVALVKLERKLAGLHRAALKADAAKVRRLFGGCVDAPVS